MYKCTFFHELQLFLWFFFNFTLPVDDIFIQNYILFHLGKKKPNFKNRVSSHFEFWVGLNSPEWLLNIIKHGVSTPFETNPPKVFLPKSSLILSRQNFLWVKAKLQEFLDYGFVLMVKDPPDCVLSLKNTSQKIALIHDMSPLNEYVEKSKFTLEGWEEMFEYSKGAKFAVPFDLKKYYHQIAIHCDFRIYFGFTFPFFEDKEPQYFIWNTLPYGYNTAPFIARSLMKPLISK